MWTHGLESEHARFKEWCKRTLQRILSEYEDGRTIVTLGTLDATLNQAELVYCELVALDAVGELDLGRTMALQLSAIQVIQDINSSQCNSSCYSSNLLYNGSVGTIFLV